MSLEAIIFLRIAASLMSAWGTPAALLASRTLNVDTRDPSFNFWHGQDIVVNDNGKTVLLQWDEAEQIHHELGAIDMKEAPKGAAFVQVYD